jgi:hypothetical protein
MAADGCHFDLKLVSTAREIATYLMLRRIDSTRSGWLSEVKLPILYYSLILTSTASIILVSWFGYIKAENNRFNKIWLAD